MTTYATMRSRIADEISDSNLTTQINRAILSAIALYERQRFYFNTRVTDTFAFVADQEYYGSAALAAIPNLIAIDDMYATIGTTRYQILPATFDEIAAMQDGGMTADPPYRYAYHAQQLRMYPIPSAVRTVTMADHYRLTALSADGDSNAWTTDAEELIRCHAKHDLATNVTNDDGMAARMERRIPTLLAALKRETNMRRRLKIAKIDAPFVAGDVYDIRVG